MENKKVEINYSRALITKNSFNKEARTFDVVFATETPVFRQGWEENFNEILSCNPENVRQERMIAGLPLFDNHQWNKSAVGDTMKAGVLGKVRNIRFENNEIIGTVHLGARADDALLSDIENDIVSGVSVGYNVYTYERQPLAVGEKTPNYIATDWEPMEVSLAPVPADINSKVRSQELLIKNRNNMPETTEPVVEPTQVVEPTTPVVEPTAEPVVEPTQSVEEVRSQASQSEKARLASILLSTRAAKIEDAKAIEYFQSGKSIEEVRQLIIEEFTKNDPKTMNVTVGAEAIDKKRNGVEAALLSRVAPAQFKDEKNEGSEFRGMSLIEMGKELLTERGVNVRGLSKNEVAGLCFGQKRDLSTSDFPLLLDSLANKMLRAEYGYAPEYWDLIAKQTTVNDFKAKNLYQVDSVNGMVKTPEGDEIKYGKLVESKQTIKVESFAEGLKFTRQAFINDDLSAFSIIPSKFVLDWNTIKGDLVWGMITGNVTMSDNKALFHADHKNLAGTAGVLSDTSLATALVAFKNQVGIDGKRKIRVQPKFLIVSAEYEITARKLLAIVAPTATSDVNVFSSMGLVLIVEPRLSGKAWYISADPNAIDSLYYAYLDGNGGLRSSRVEDFDTDSIKFAVRGEFGVAAIDYRGLYKNAGE